MKKVLLLFLIMLVAIASLYKISKSRTFQLLGEIIPRVNTQKKIVALTFDDGPSEKTDTILAILSGVDVKATFFVTGSALEKHRKEGEKIVASGHELGNHSYSHQRMVFKSMKFVQKEIETTDSLIRSVGYKGNIHFRPPFGKRLLILPYYLNKHKRKNIMWDVEPESFSHIDGNSEKITQHVLENTKPGSIILLHVMHEDRKESMKAIEGIVSGLRQKGYKFQTISELLQNKDLT